MNSEEAYSERSIAPCKGLRTPESGKFLLVESRIREVYLVESGIPGFGIRDIAQGIQIGIRNPSSTDEESEIQYLESGIHGVESRIQDCLGFRYMGREVSINALSFH